MVAVTIGLYKKALLSQRTAQCRCKIQYLSKFTAASRCSPCYSTAFVDNGELNNGVSNQFLFSTMTDT